MVSFRLLFPSFKARAVTFSYDDGVLQDEKVVGILNKYHLKGTFNVNAGLSGQEKIRGGIDCSYLKLEESLGLYRGHEIANHTYHHPHLEELPFESQYEEYRKNLMALEKLFTKDVKGSAYPYGTYNLDTITVLNDLHVAYARTTQSTYDFHRPYDFLLWHPTIHHRDDLLLPTLEKFYQSQDELPIFYLWGHSYEFALDDNFEILDGFCKDISKHEDVWSATNLEIYAYVQSAKFLYYRKGSFVNPSGKEIFFQAGHDLMSIQPHSILNYGEDNL
jgi:hypothetical protein